MITKKTGMISVLLVLVAALGFFLLKDKPGQVISPKKNEVVSPAPVLKSSINGLEVSPEIADRRPIAVMIENHPDSRPQSGLAEADLVYETLAEGGITRFMAVYQTVEAKDIGPIRSAREYYAVLANEIGAIYAHVGGSDEVIGQLKEGVYKNISDANEYYNENFFQRIKSRYAPHNVYTSIQRLKELAEYRKYLLKASFEPWKFKFDAPASGATQASKIVIDFSLPGYEAVYAYASSTNSYIRNMAGKPHKDAATGKQIAPKTVIVQLVSVTPVPNDVLLSVDINLTGQGKAWVFQDGGVIQAAWKKTGDSRTRYYDQFGSEISFNRGQVWVELVPTEKESQLVWK